MWDNVYQRRDGQYASRAPTYDDDPEHGLVVDAIRDTEQEIADSPWNNDSDDNDGDTSLEQVEGPDGEPLSDDEIAETNINGHDDNNLGRPLQIAADESLVEQNQRDATTIAELRARLDALENGPQRQAQFREARLQQFQGQTGFLHTDRAQAEQLLDGVDALRNRISQLETERAGNSFAAAHQRYGATFEQAYNSFNRMDLSNPTAQALHREVLSAPDPGERMMALNGSAIRGMHNTRGQYPPSLNSASGGSSHRAGTSRRGGNSNDDGGSWGSWGNRDTEMSIFEYGTAR